MFKKNNNKATVRFTHESEGFSGSSTSVPLNERKFFDYLKSKNDHHGQLVIRYISEENEVDLTTVRTLEHRNSENRISEINDVIRNYIKGRAISMDAHAVFSEGILKGVFGSETDARLKRQQLVSRGYVEANITIKPLKVDSFDDFE